MIDFEKVNQDKKALCAMSMQVMKEILFASQLSNADLAIKIEAEMSRSVGQDERNLDEKMISKYKTGKKAMSQRRMILLSQIAKRNGWRGGLIDLLALLGEGNFPENNKSLNELNLQSRKNRKRAENAALAHFEKGINFLLDQEWENHHIMALLAFMLSKLNADNRNINGFGIINPAKLVAHLDGDSSKFPNHALMKWEICELQEILPAE